MTPGVVLDPPEPASRDSFHAVIVELESQAGSADVTGAGTIVEELDEVRLALENSLTWSGVPNP